MLILSRFLTFRRCSILTTVLMAYLINNASPERNLCISLVLTGLGAFFAGVNLDSWLCSNFSTKHLTLPGSDISLYGWTTFHNHVIMSTSTKLIKKKRLLLLVIFFLQSYIYRDKLLLCNLWAADNIGDNFIHWRNMVTYTRE